jgi:hypothetical protein
MRERCRPKRQVHVASKTPTITPTNTSVFNPSAIKIKFLWFLLFHVTVLTHRLTQCSWLKQKSHAQNLLRCRIMNLCIKLISSLFLKNDIIFGTHNGNWLLLKFLDVSRCCAGRARRYTQGHQLFPGQIDSSQHMFTATQLNGEN